MKHNISGAYELIIKKSIGRVQKLAVVEVALKHKAPLIGVNRLQPLSEVEVQLQIY
jgi:hypothetical protein